MATIYKYPIAVRPYQAEKAPDPSQITTILPQYLAKTTQLLQRAIPVQGGLLQVFLTDDQVITLPTTINAIPIDAGTPLYIEVVQDATGGWDPSWTNATSDAGIVPAPATAPFDATLYLGVWNGAVWVLMQIAAGYTAVSDAVYSLVLTLALSAFDPLARVAALVDGYALVFT